MKKIMFSDDYCLTKAVLDGTKTMTRRLLKVPKTCNGKEVYSFNILTNNAGTQCVDLVDENGGVLGSWKPHYEVGEVVAIAQSYKSIADERDEAETVLGLHKIGDNFLTIDEMGAGWNNKMFVKANLMKHHIRITDVKAERLQSISDADILKEGVWQYPNLPMFFISKSTGYTDDIAFPFAREAFSYLIDRISGRGTWESNSWVVAYEFKLID